MNGAAKPNVVILGGGLAGLESAFYLQRKLNGGANTTLVSDKDHFLFKPNTIYIPFGMDPDKLTFKLDKPMKKAGIDFVHGRADGIDPDTKRVYVGDRKIPYDFLVVATGAEMRPQEIPGLSEFANTIFTPDAMMELRVSLTRLLADAKRVEHRKVLFVLPPNNKCAGPLYEIVQMLDTWLRRNGVRREVEIVWTTFESGYIQAFGPRLNEAVEGEFERRDIVGMRGRVVESIDEHEVAYADGTTLEYDLLISFPPYVASTPFEALPIDDRGFIATNPETRQVLGYPDIYAAGDTADFPVKQAFLAFLQADATAEHLAAHIKGTEPDYAFDPVSMCVMEQFDKATFAQVPLVLTGDPKNPVAIRPNSEDTYKVGSGQLWRLGKKLLGYYIPWRFKAGQPFHAGVPWKGMEIGLSVMSKVMAS